MFSKTSKAKEIPSVTQFLVNNPVFRKFVIGTHNARVEAFEKADNYLEKELLGKDAHAAKYNVGRIDASKSYQGKSKSSSKGKKPANR